MDDLLKAITERLQQLKAIREQHQQLAVEYQQALQQLTAQVNAETGAIAELERLLKPEAEKTETPKQGDAK